MNAAPEMMSPTATEAVAEWAVEGAGGNEEAKGSGVTLVEWRSVLKRHGVTRETMLGDAPISFVLDFGCRKARENRNL